MRPRRPITYRDEAAGIASVVLILAGFAAVVVTHSNETVSCRIAPGSAPGIEKHAGNATYATLPHPMPKGEWTDARCCSWAASFNAETKPEPCGRFYP